MTTNYKVERTFFRAVLAAMSVCVLFLCVTFGSCKNVLHDVFPDSGDRILSFTLPCQRGEASIGDTTITIEVDPNAEIRSIVPQIGISNGARILPLTLSYLLAAFPTITIDPELFGLYNASDQQHYVIDLIMNHADECNIPEITIPIDFSGTVRFLVLAANGNQRWYETNAIPAKGASILEFAFTKYDNPEITREAAGVIDEAAHTISVEAYYPDSYSLDWNLSSKYEVPFKLIPSFKTSGDSLYIEENGIDTELNASRSLIDFNEHLLEATLTRKLIVTNIYGDREEYTLYVIMREDPLTIRSITDFRFTRALNPDIEYTTMADSILDYDEYGDDNYGSIHVRVLYSGSVAPRQLVASFITPGSASVNNVEQQSRVTSNDFSTMQYYRVISRNGLFTRLYTVTVDMISVTEGKAKITSFKFTMNHNAALIEDAIGSIDHGAKLIIVTARYISDDIPYNLIADWTAEGLVSVGSITQISGASVQNFRFNVRYYVRYPDPLLSVLDGEYAVDVTFIKDSSNAAMIRSFTFNNSGNLGAILPDPLTARVDQSAQTITATFPLGTAASLGPNAALKPVFDALGTVSVAGAAQTSGTSEAPFIAGGAWAPVQYTVTSDNGQTAKIYTVILQEINSRFYVKQDAAGRRSGKDWANAFTTVQEALLTARNLDAATSKEIWIAAGNYLTDSGGLLPNLSLYGGFTGNETNLTERSVDVNANLVTITGSNGARHIFKNVDNTSSGLLRLDRLRIANADAGGSEDGAGISLDYSGGSGEIIFRDLVFENLSARRGAAIFVKTPGSLSIENLAVNNAAASEAGSAVYAETSGSGGDLVLQNVSFLTQGSISVAKSGGVIYVATSGSDSTLTLDNIKVDGAAISAGEKGGAIYAQTQGAGSELTLTKIEVTAASASSGGAGGVIYAKTAGSALGVTNVTLGGAASAAQGGVLALESAVGAISVDGLGFDSASATTSGSVIYANASGSGNISLKNISKYAAQSKVSGSGGVIFAQSGSGDITFLDEIKTTSDTATPGATGSGGIIYAKSGGAVRFQGDIDIVKSEAGGSGGVIYAEGGAVDFADIKVQESKGGSGGAIYALGGSGGVNFTGVNIKKSAALGGNGGAIYAEATGSGYVNFSGTLSFAGSQAADISATGSGGAVYAAAVSGNVVFEKAVNAANTSATGNGGAVYATSSGQIQFAAVTASATSASGSGGAIYAKGGSLDFRGTLRFTGTSAGGSGGGLAALTTGSGTTYLPAFSADTVHSGDNGGVVYVSAGSGAVIFDGAISDVKGAVYATGGGGVVYVSGTGAITFNSAISIAGSQAYPVYAGAYGGVVRASSAGAITFNGTINIAGSQANHIYAGQSGGAIYAYSSGGAVQFAQVTANYTDAKGSGSGGGAIYANGSKVAFTGAQSYSNATSAGSGGAVYASGGGGGVVFASTVTAQATSAVYSGGAVYAYSGSGTIQFSGKITASNTSTTNYGGAVYASSSNRIQIGAASYTSTSAGGSGGGLYARATETGTVSIAGFTASASHSSGDYGGGVVCVQAVSGDVTFESGVIDVSSSQSASVYAYNYGGAIYVSTSTGAITFNSTINITGTQTHPVYAGQSGGAIFVSSGSGTVQFAQVTASYTDAEGGQTGPGGGAIYAHGGSLNFTGHLSFDHTTTKFNGGALNVVSDGLVQFAQLTASNTSSLRSGGAMYVYGRSSDVNFTGALSFTSTMASSAGGALHIQVDGGSVRMSPPAGQSNTFTDTSAPSTSGGFGGAIFLDTGSSGDRVVTLTNTTFLRATAGYQAGAIQLQMLGSGTKTVTVSGVTFTDCYAPLLPNIAALGVTVP